LPRKERGICFRKVFIKRMKGRNGSQCPGKLLDGTQQRQLPMATFAKGMGFVERGQPTPETC
jgi:hypothetical protein